MMILSNYEPQQPVSKGCRWTTRENKVYVWDDEWIYEGRYTIGGFVDESIGEFDDDHVNNYDRSMRGI